MNFTYRIYFGLLALAIFSWPSCSEKKSEGRTLAELYCQSCHLLSAPNELDYSTWKYSVLPSMAERLGINTGRTAQIHTLKLFNLFPDEAIISFEDWEKIRDYYLSLAPIFLTIDSTYDQSIPSQSLFDPNEPNLKSISPFISLLKIDSSEKAIYLGNANSRALYKLNHIGQITDSIYLNGIPSFLNRKENTLRVLLMDKLMPHDEAGGTLIHISEDSYGKLKNPQVIEGGLRRPVDADFGDLNGDGLEDMVISSFGNTVGNLSWYKGINDKTFELKNLDNYPGNIESLICDYDSDGRQDILSLSAQGDEKLILYKNIGDSNFEAKILLRFPPSFGSTHFEYADFTGDGIKDILYTNGDNGDYKPIYKAYHGIRLFSGKENGSFDQVFFLPLNGTFKAVMKDFDLDGDLDIAAISYFPDYSKNPDEGFTYFENLKHSFRRYHLPQGQNGKWIVMDTGDLDGDGDEDIILGSAMFMASEVPVNIKQLWLRQTSPLLILKNKTK